jgi:hypothetical protein
MSPTDRRLTTLEAMTATTVVTVKRQPDPSVSTIATRRTPDGCSTASIGKYSVPTRVVEITGVRETTV